MRYSVCVWQHVNILQYTDAEYRQLLTSETWSRAHTDSLMDLCVMFDLRWPVINDRLVNFLIVFGEQIFYFKFLVQIFLTTPFSA